MSPPCFRICRFLPLLAPEEGLGLGWGLSRTDICLSLTE